MNLAETAATVTVPMSGTAADALLLARTHSLVLRVRRRVAQTRGHGVWIAVWSVVGWSGTLLAPVLADRPFLVMMLAPRALFVALATDSVSLATFVVLGTLRLSATDASYFILGRRFPRGGRRPGRIERSRGRVLSVGVRYTDRLCRWICAHGYKAGTVLFFRPNGKYLAVAGAYGVSSKVAGVASVVGTVLYLTFFHLGLGLLL